MKTGEAYETTGRRDRGNLNIKAFSTCSVLSQGFRGMGKELKTLLVEDTEGEAISRTYYPKFMDSVVS